MEGAVRAASSARVAIASTVSAKATRLESIAIAMLTVQKACSARRATRGPGTSPAPSFAHRIKFVLKTQNAKLALTAGTQVQTKYRRTTRSRDNACHTTLNRASLLLLGSQLQALGKCQLMRTCNSTVHTAITA